VAEDVVDDPQLIDDPALLAAEQRVRVVAGDRPQPQRAVPAQVRAQVGRGQIRIVGAVRVAHAHAEHVPDHVAEPRRLSLQRAVGRHDGGGGRRRLS